jgi:single-strand DNA-binding protein
MNRVELVGYLGSDIELRETATGKTISKVRIATHEQTKDKNGEYKKVTTWHTVTIFGKTAENLRQYACKGSLLWVESSLAYTVPSTDKELVSLVARKVQILSKKIIV